MAKYLILLFAHDYEGSRQKTWVSFGNSKAHKSA